MTSSSKSEDAFAYLLGEMTPIQAEAYELDLFTDDPLFETLLSMEEELVDKFVRGELPFDRRLRFEARYLTTTEGRERVANAKAFHERFHRTQGWMDWLKSLKSRRIRATT